jgi:hypothetical protein
MNDPNRDHPMAQFHRQEIGRLRGLIRDKCRGDMSLCTDTGIRPLTQAEWDRYLANAQSAIDTYERTAEYRNLKTAMEWVLSRVLIGSAKPCV